MCGIAGGVSLVPGVAVDCERVTAMSRCVAHRGPDASGFWKAPSDQVCFAHRRLSVIDPDCGQQPMSDVERGLHLVFNGEIYNYRELRRSLLEEGVSFRTDSDTEVLLWMYRKHGISCLDHLVGMFAFAIWDALKGELFLVRDRAGEKPLYYTLDAQRLYFASSFGALDRTNPHQREPDPSAVSTFLNLGYIPAPSTIHAEIHKLRAGTYLRIDASGIETATYWTPASDVVPFEGTYALALDRLRELVEASVRIRLRSDVPLGVFLSGGIDSSLVAAVATSQMHGGIETFSIAFDEAEFDESAFAAQVAAAIGSRHRTFRAHADLLSMLPNMVSHYGEPFGDSSALPTWLLAERAREFVTVALGGDGGDEAFAGYDWYRNALRLKRLASFSGILNRAIAATPASTAWATASRIKRGASLLAMDDAHRFAALRSFIGSGEAKRLYSGALAETYSEGEVPGATLLSEWYRRAPGKDLRRMRTVDLATYLPDCLLTKVDVATMAHGLEARAPLLDPAIIEFALTLPQEWVVTRAGGKQILKELLYTYLPAQLFDRPKQGFSVPIRHWFRSSLRTAVEQLPFSEPLMGTGWFQRDGLQSMVNEHVAGTRNHDQRLYFLLVLDQWLSQR